MNLTQAPDRYDPAFVNRQNAELARVDRSNRKTGVDIELSKDKLILRSPDGSRFALAVSNAGVLSATAL